MTESRVLSTPSESDIDEGIETLDCSLDESSEGSTARELRIGEAAPWDKRSFARIERGEQLHDSRSLRRTRRKRAATGPPPTIALGYVRVSTDEQTLSGAGLTAQRAAIETDADRRRWRLLDIVEDAGFSGRDLKRPGIQTVLQALRSKEASALMVAKVDRLSRSLLDFATLLDRSAKEGWALVALDLGVDTSTATGEALANMVATFSQFERRLIGQRTKDALAAKRAQGVQLGRPRAVPDTVVERMRYERTAGATLRGIADGIDRDRIPTAQGGRQWHPATVRDVLRSFERRTANAKPPATIQAADRG
jgi:DNA invertase Pin-like site-specific DNA recombinase